MSAHLNIPAVQAAMKQNGLSGRKLAEQLGVSRNPHVHGPLTAFVVGPTERKSEARQGAGPL